MDIRSITQNGKNTIFNAITEKEEQLMSFNHSFGQTAHSLALYFHIPGYYSEEKVHNALVRYLDHPRYHKAIDTIYCIVNDDETEIKVIKK